MKKFLFLFLTIILALQVVGCTKSNDKEQPDDGNNTEKPIDEIKGTIKIIAPTGAPSLSHLKIVNDAAALDYTIGNYKITFETANGAQGVQAAITSKSHDVIVSPINLGIKLYKSNKTYKYLANVTDGNLFFASTSPITIEDLKTKDLVFFGQGTINEAIVNKVLSYNEINRTDIQYLADTNTTQQQLVADANPNTIYLVAEPVLSAAKKKLSSQGKTVYTLDVQKLFNEASSGMNFLQAGVFVKSDIDSEFVTTYLKALEESINYVNQNVDEAAKLAQSLNLNLPAEAVLKVAIPGCNLHFRKSNEIKDSVNALVNLNPTLFGGEVDSEIYY